MLRVLALDIEGGYGGSSRSLYESVCHLAGSRVSVEVWCRRVGPIQARYSDLGVPCKVFEDMPQGSALPTPSRNVFESARMFSAWRRSAGFRELLAGEVDRRFDLVHFNHEGLFLLSRWLRRRVHKPLTMHIRTNLEDNWFARRQVQIASATIDEFVFITENEQAHFARLGGRPEGPVIYNIATVPPDTIAPHPGVPHDGRLCVACLSNFSWQRGTDRLAEIAAALRRLGRRDVLFVVAGRMEMSRSLPGRLKQTARRGDDFADHVRACGLEDMFLFLGHVQAPERVLAACDVLVKPTREHNPWGRDILEALAAGRPVASVGTYGRFVETNGTGLLQPEFDADGVARWISSMADDRAQCRRIGEAGRQRVSMLCSGLARGRDLAAFWERIARQQGQAFGASRDIDRQDV